MTSNPRRNHRDRFFAGALPLVAVCALAAMAQPELDEANTLPEIPCSVDTSATAQVDTVVSTPDSNGFYTVFDGTSSRGWWQDCLTPHSQGNSALGGIWRIDTVRRAIYSMSRNGVGGILMTKKKYAHYEIQFDWWPQYGNDGGVFNRSTLNGRSNQVVLDYLSGSGAIYGIWSENSFPPTGRNYRPWTYNGTAAQGGDTTIVIPGSGGNGDIRSNWTQMTARLNPTQYGCAPTGCVAADVRRIWNPRGWNQARIVYYGGLNPEEPGGNVIYTQTYTRIYYPKTNTDGPYSAPVPGVSDTAQWIPVLRDSVTHTPQQIAQNPASWIGLQIHSGGRWVYENNGGLGTWYRNIKIRYLDSDGVPVAFSTSVNPEVARTVRYDFAVQGGRLVGSLDLDHVITVTDTKGRLLARERGIAGRNLRYELPAHAGMMLVQIRSMRGTQTLRVDGNLLK